MIRRAAAALLLLAPGAALAVSTGPQPGLAGVPAGGGFPAEMACNQCHASFPLSPDDHARLTLEGLPERYEPGRRYELTLAVADDDPDRVRWGFQVTAVSLATFQGAGDLAVTDAAATQAAKGALGGRQYLSHAYGGTRIGEKGGARWSFAWTAPKTPAGDVGFFAVANAANADGSQNGDKVYTRSPEPLAVARAPEEAKQDSNGGPVR